MENIPENRFTCKYCWYCACIEETVGDATCWLDIGCGVDVDDECCDAFEYDPNFARG